MKLLLMMATCLGITLLCSLFIADTVNAETRGIVTGGSVNVRSYPVINNTNRITQVRRGQMVEILDIQGDFFRVHVGDLNDVYISRDWVNIVETSGIVNYYSVAIYNLPRHEGGYPIGRLYSGSTVTLTSSIDDWFGFTYDDGPAFIEAEHVIVPEFVQLPTARINYTLADEIVATAMQYLGARYVWGGTTPAGFDCSGFMVYVFRQFDIGLNRRSVDMANNGVHVNRADIQPGDLLFFNASAGGRISHVGMYIGGGEMIHASTVATGVRLSSLYSDFNRARFVTARRVI